MRHVGVVLLAAALLSSTTSVAAEETIRLPATADAGVIGGSQADVNTGTAEFLPISGYLSVPSPPEITIEPADPETGDRLTVRIKTSSTAPDTVGVRYTYAWGRHRGRGVTLMQSSEKPDLKLTVQAGERWRAIVVAAIDKGKAAGSWAEVDVAGGVKRAGKPARSPWGQFRHRRAYLAFDLTPLTGREIVSARLRLYARPDVSWRRAVADTAIVVHAAPREQANFDQAGITWRNQPTPDLVGKPLARLDLPGRSVKEDDPDWQAWSKRHKASWKDRGKHATAFSNDPKYGFWRWRELDVAVTVRRELTAGARRIAFCLAEPSRSTHRRSACAVRSREYLQGQYAPVLEIACK